MESLFPIRLGFVPMGRPSGIDCEVRFARLHGDTQSQILHALREVRRNFHDSTSLIRAMSLMFLMLVRIASAVLTMPINEKFIALATVIVQDPVDALAAEFHLHSQALQVCAIKSRHASNAPCVRPNVLTGAVIPAIGARVETQSFSPTRPYARFISPAWR